MNIVYSNKRVKKQCTDLKQAKKDFPMKIAKKLLRVVNFIEAADSLSSVINMPTYRFHALKGDKVGVFSIDVDGIRGSYRLLVSFNNLEPGNVFSNSDFINIITIEEVSKHYE